MDSSAAEASKLEITCCWEIEQTTEAIPEHLLRRPSDNETWRQRFVTKFELDVLRPMIEALPTAHIVQEARGLQYAEIAVTKPCLQFMSTLSIPLRIESNFPKNQTTPREGEINVYGIATARQRTEMVFMLSATEAIWSAKYGHGLDRYYLRYTRNRTVLVKLVWAMLLHRILQADEADRRTFIQNCCFVGLHALSATEDISEFLDRDEETWVQHFLALYNDRVMWPLADAEEEIHLASLLWGLLESAENSDLSHSCLQFTHHSAGENLRKLAKLIGIRVNSQPLNFGQIDQGYANRVLPACKMFECAGELHVARLTERICKYVPLGPEAYGDFPPV